MKNPQLAATKGNHPIESHEKNELLDISEPVSALFKAAGGGPEGGIVVVFLFSGMWLSLKI